MGAYWLRHCKVTNKTAAEREKTEERESQGGALSAMEGCASFLLSGMGSKKAAESQRSAKTGHGSYMGTLCTWYSTFL